MLGALYVFAIVDPSRGIGRIVTKRCLNDVQARQEIHVLPGVIRITEAGRQVWPRPEHSDAQTSGGAA